MKIVEFFKKVLSPSEGCRTPEAVYHIYIGKNEVSCTVDLPELDLGEEQAIELENEIHDAMEAVLAQFF